MSSHFHTLKVNDVRKETKDCVSVSLELPTELKTIFSFLAGQYLTFKIKLNNTEVRRSYSICSSPFENEWRVAIKQVENGIFSTFANTSLKKGDTLEVMPPMGNFKLTAEDQSKSIVLFAAGSGITPIFSILKSVLEDGKGDVTLFYGNKGFNGIIFREELEAWKNKYMNRLRIVHVFSRESPGSKIQKGRINKEKSNDLFDAFLANITVDKVFICGPEQMILDVKSSLIEKGVEPSKINFELFGVNLTQVKNKEEIRPSFSTKVEIILDDDLIDFVLDSNGPTILDAAQQAGADLPFACKGGVCCTCKARVLEGSVTMDVNYALTPEEVKQGYVLTCQAHPTTTHVKVTFDD
ncbi:MAG: 2Fe-2S iron-sulfur cluster binding domain-containing protein [Bacteroidetes bacterium]|nr:2Fe-2S iron-sulfur cluster binding domain-containing protein [Bacteroidota bacterium]